MREKEREREGEGGRERERERARISPITSEIERRDRHAKNKEVKQCALYDDGQIECEYSVILIVHYTMNEKKL